MTTSEYLPYLVAHGVFIGASASVKKKWYLAGLEMLLVCDLATIAACGVGVMLGGPA